MSYRNDKFKIRLLGVISIILLCFSFTVKSFLNDTFYMIKLGDYIYHNGIDLMDHYCWITDLSYTYPHWLYDFLLYIVYLNFGYDGIYYSTILLFIFFVLIIYYVNIQKNNNEFMSFLVSILSIFVLKIFVCARAQLITSILFFLEVYFIEKLLSGGKVKYMILLIFISLLIANLHATVWLFYFVLYLPFIGEHLFYKLKYCGLFRKKVLNSNKEVENIQRIVIEKLFYFKKLILVFGLSFLMGLFTPSRICYSYVFRIMLGDSQMYISEHAPLVITQHPFFLVCLLILFGILLFSNTKMYLREFFMIGGLMVMCFLSGRHLVFFYTIGIFYISVFCCRYFKEKKDRTFDILGVFLVRNKIIYLSFLCFIIIVFTFNFQKNSVDDYVPKDEYPVDAVSYIKNNLDVNSMRLYNDYNFGSYLLFQDIPVFIDSRCDLYLREFNGLSYSIFDDAMLMKTDYEEKFDFYGITHVLVYNNSFLAKLLKLDDAYQLLYEDSNFILFENR